MFLPTQDKHLCGFQPLGAHQRGAMRGADATSKLVGLLSSVQLFVIPWTVSLPRSSVHGIFSRQEHWNGFALFLLQGNLPNPGDGTQVSLHCRQTLCCLSHQARATGCVKTRRPNVRGQGIPARG